MESSELKYLTNGTISNRILWHQEDYNARLKLICVAYKKLYTIFTKNNIDVAILDVMDISKATESLMSFELLIGTSKYFTIKIDFFNRDKGPTITLTFKHVNTIRPSKIIIQEFFIAYEERCELPASFMLTFKTLLPKYCI